MNTTAELTPPELKLDQEGFLQPGITWNKDIACTIAYGLGIESLGHDHWRVIKALRMHYEKFSVAPAIHNICVASGKYENWVHDLFQTCLNAWRVAGLPDPGEEAKAYLNDM